MLFSLCNSIGIVQVQMRGGNVMFEDSRFIALPVGQGDSFFIVKKGMTALVDGGKAVNTFPALYKENTGLNGVNILVCTHNDADHVGGLIGYLQSGLKCCEVWLPALWGGRLVDLLREPFRFIEELIDNICNL